ncbi:histidine kinase dimerization/phosphoacceptor domain -containing protein [Sphingomonas sp. 22176]|uniref:histidine kinase dimerization/phosphoacceptor domain -containing protein n=1 Tax=Sphingomonas sp. 22176 TaxID=3453884 RepID=UPI003F824BC9
MPSRRLNGSVQMGIGACFAACGFITQHVLSGALGGFPLLMFVPAVFLSAIMAGKAAGATTTLIGATLAAYFIVPPRHSFALTAGSALALMIFLLVGIGMSLVIETLRRSIEKLNESEGAKALLLEELAHRTKNDLAIVSSAITLQRNASTDPAVRDALAAANARVLVVARAQERLRGGKADGRVDLEAYVSELCHDLGDLLRDVRPIAVRVRCPRLPVQTDLAVNVGLIVNELVTNSLKYAFPSDRGGTVDVTIQAEPGRLTIEVRDDGIGCDDLGRAGLGSKLVRLLAKQLAGTVEREDGRPGYVVRVTLSSDAIGTAVPQV